MTTNTRDKPIVFRPANDTASGLPTLDFVLPPELEANAPPEVRHLSRDTVRLLVSHIANDRITHTRFTDLPAHLNPGDLVVINTSGTLNAALTAHTAEGTPLTVHLSTRLPANLWSVELRQPTSKASQPYRNGRTGQILTLPSGGQLDLLAPYQAHQRGAPQAQVRLWIATLNLPLPLEPYLAAHGVPIRYNYVNTAWPSQYYQTVYATEPGSAEMPSAGRAFTPELITRLTAQGVQLAPLLLHTGVASLEDHEPPYEEFYRVPPETARQVNLARANGHRVIAVGTTVVRALETVTAPNGEAAPGSGWTDLVIGPKRPMRAVDGLLTGFHEPRATHLAMLETLAGQRHLTQTYKAALEHRYLWHEFGDLHLILP